MSPTSVERSHTFEPEGRKRVPKACDRCRLKKVKCDGNLPCPRCRMEDAVCHFGARRKSAERPIAPGYIDQLETQQKILIKALKKTWKCYAPVELRNRLGDDPSIHEIVKNLGALEDASGLHAISPDFYFNESLNPLEHMVKIESDPASSKVERTSSLSSDSSCASVPKCINTTIGAGLADPSSPHSSASSHTSIDSASSLNKTLQSSNGNSSSQPTKYLAPAAIRPKMEKPTFCPLPKTLFAAPVKPSRIVWDGPELGTSVQELDESMWTTPDASWDNSEYAAQAPASSFSRAFDDLPPMADVGWGNLIDDQAQYVQDSISR